MTTPVVLPRPRVVPEDDASGSARSRTRDTASGPLMIVVGGVPGAGKSTLLAHVSDDVPRSVVLDPDRYRRRIAARVPSWVPYGAYRWAVHTLHAVETAVRLVRGPRTSAPVLVHDTATRPLRREVLGLLARVRGWTPVLVAVDVSLADALDGQLDRGRLVEPHEFLRHWERWSTQRSALASVDGGPRGPWQSVRLLARTEALRQVRDLAMRRTSAVEPVVAAQAIEPGRSGRPCAA